MNKKFKFLLLSLLLIIYTISIIPKEFQNDTFFDIALGEIIIDKGLTNQEELVFHENLEFKNPRWFFDYLVANIYNSFGEAGIYGLVLLIGALEMLLYFYIVYSISKNMFFSFVYSLLIATYTRSFNTARGQLLSLFMFLIIFYSLDNYFKTYKKRYIVMIIAALPVIAYTHGSVYVVTLTLFMPYIVEFIVSKIKKINFERKIIINDRKIGLLIIPIIAFVFIGLITPNRLNLLTYTYKTMQGVNNISEMKPIGFFDDAFFSVSLVALFLIVVFSKTKIRLTDLLYVVGYAILSFKASRGSYYFYLIASISMFRIICDYLNDYGIKLENGLKTGVIYKVLFSTFMIFIFTFSINRFLMEANEEYIPYNLYPVDAANYIIDNINYKQDHIYTDYDYGSYFEFKGIPVFIDSRAELFTSAFNENTTILNEYFLITYDHNAYNEIFDKYDIKYVTIRKETDVIFSYIKKDDKWKLIYDDGCFTIYERK